MEPQESPLNPPLYALPGVTVLWLSMFQSLSYSNLNQSSADACAFASLASSDTYNWYEMIYGYSFLCLVSVSDCT